MYKTISISVLAIVTFATEMFLIELGSVQGITFTPPPGNEAPRETSGGASRGGRIPNQPSPDNKAPKEASERTSKPKDGDRTTRQNVIRQ